VIISTIILRLWFAVTILPAPHQYLMSWMLFSVYCAIAAPISLSWGLTNLDTVQVWWNLQLYAYGLRLHNNRRALWLMLSLIIWLTFEELVLRLALIPSAFEQLPSDRWWAWVVLSWSISTLKYPIFYGRINKLFNRPGALVLGAGLEIVCTGTYIISQSLWLTIFLHWIVVVVWLLPMGGRYLLWHYKKNHTEATKKAHHG
jgi:predicted Abi (CAAX) family protease